MDTYSDSPTLTVSILEAARQLRISEPWARELVRQGRLRTVVVGAKGGKRLIPVTELAAFLERESK
jgi:excisionase family DNA binding protein